MARRQALVCQYIEGLSSEGLELYADIIKELVGRRHGVYALYRRDRLYYVGLAGNLRGRLRAHLKDRHKGLWDKFSVYLTIDDGHMRELESLVVRIAQPQGNRQKGKFAKSENLLSVLKQRFKQRHELEWARLIGAGMSSREAADAVSERKDQRDLPELARYITRPMTLKAVYKKKSYTARVRRNGTIRVGKKVFDAPSAAARSIVGRAANGWWFWKYERAPGQWVRLRELRKK